MRQPKHERESITCKYCGIIFSAAPSQRRQFCSPSCSKSGRFGEANNGWKGGKHIHKTTKRTFIRTKERKYKFEYRIIMEEILGRSLHKNEVVHHKDEDPTNNNPDNLEVMTRSEHISLHNRLNPRRDHVRDSLGRFSQKL